MENNLAEIKKAYSDLITAYINALNESTKTRVFQGRPGLFFTKLFIESYIKSNLTELSNSLRYYNEKLKVQNNFKTESTWIADRIIDCNELSKTLTSWQSAKNIIGVFTPLIIGLITAKLGIETIYQAINLTYLQTVLFISLPYIGMLLILLGLDFSAKHFALKKFDIYRIESTLFSLLDRKLKDEFPFDLFQIGIGGNILLADTVYFAYTFDSMMTNVYFAKYHKLPPIENSDNSMFVVEIIGIIALIIMNLWIAIDLRKRMKKQK